MSDGSHLPAELRQRAVAAIHQGLAVGQVATAYGVSRITVFRWVRQANAQGEQGLQRKTGSGRPRKRDDLTEDELRAIVVQPASNFGYETERWTVGRLRPVIQEQFQVSLSRMTVWRRLRHAGLTYQKAEREHDEIDEQTRKKWLR